MFYWILTLSLLVLKSRAYIYISLAIRMDACITSTGWYNGGSVLMSEKMQKLDENVNWFSFFLKKHLFKYIVDHPVLSTETWMLSSRHHPSALLRSVKEAGDRTRARGGLRLSFPARVPPTGSACLVRSVVLSLSPTGVKQKLLVTLCAADSCSCQTRCSLSGRHRKSAPLLLTIKASA